jgi:hypothetical protein
MSNSSQLTFTTLSLETLDTVSGGIDRNTYTNVGGHAAEIGVLAGGAAGGAAMGGPGGAAAGTAAAEVANRSGIPKQLGQKLGGAVWDAGTALGEGAFNAYQGVRHMFGARN